MGKKIMGTGELSRERIIAGVLFGMDPMGNKGLSVTFQEQLFKDDVAVTDKNQMSWNYSEANMNAIIPEMQELLVKLEKLLLSDNQGASILENNE
jgi:RecB family endonuclease NucS